MALAKTVPVFGESLLITPQERGALTGSYRMFDMDDLVMKIGKAKHRPRWVIEPPGDHGYFVASGA